MNCFAAAVDRQRDPVTNAIYDVLFFVSIKLSSIRLILSTGTYRVVDERAPKSDQVDPPLLNEPVGFLN